MTATAITSLGEVTEVPEKAKRRTYTAEYKLQIVKEADACKEPGEVGALLRREGAVLVAPDHVAAGTRPG